MSEVKAFCVDVCLVTLDVDVFPELNVYVHHLLYVKTAHLPLMNLTIVRRVNGN